MNRRNFFKAAGLGIGGLSLGATAVQAADNEAKPAKGSRKSKMHLGLVTYNLAGDWDIATIIKNCEAT